jgi:hypothetical protein
MLSPVSLPLLPRWYGCMLYLVPRTTFSRSDNAVSHLIKAESTSIKPAGQSCHPSSTDRRSSRTIDRNGHSSADVLAPPLPAPTILGATTQRNVTQGDHRKKEKQARGRRLFSLVLCRFKMNLQPQRWRQRKGGGWREKKGKESTARN